MRALMAASDAADAPSGDVIDIESESVKLTRSIPLYHLYYFRFRLTHDNAEPAVLTRSTSAVESACSSTSVPRRALSLLLVLVESREHARCQSLRRERR